MGVLLFLVAQVIPGIICRQTITVLNGNKYDGHQLLRVYSSNQNQANVLRGIGRDTESKIRVLRDRGPDDNKHVDILVAPETNEQLKSLLREHNIRFKVNVPNVRETLRQHLTTVNGTGSEGLGIGGIHLNVYHTYSEIMQWLNIVAATHPRVTKVFTLGTSYEGRPIKVIKIGRASKNKKPAVWIDAGIHADEWLGPATVLFFINKLVAGYGRDSQITRLVDGVDWFLLPVFNVDGYEYTWTRDRFWRKTRSMHGNNTCVGVDLNRNWNIKWGEFGTSHNSCSNNYCGPHAFSDPEIQAVASFLRSQPIQAYIALHSFGQLWMTPYSYTEEKEPKDLQELLQISSNAVRQIHRLHGTRYRYGRIAHIIGPSSGSSVDYTYGTLGIKYSFGVELRDGGTFGVLLPPEQILPSAQEVVPAFLLLAERILKDKNTK